MSQIEFITVGDILGWMGSLVAIAYYLFLGVMALVLIGSLIIALIYGFRQGWRDRRILFSRCPNCGYDGKERRHERPDTGARPGAL